MPQVDVETPAHQWRLRDEGIAGANAVAERLRSAHYRPTKIFASVEPKATETGSIIAKRLRLPFATVDGLHEHDRRAAGFLKADVFASRMRDLFAHPDEVVFGTESGSAALARFAQAVDQVVSGESGDVVVVSHGTVMSLFVASRAHVDGSELWGRARPAVIRVPRAAEPSDRRGRRHDLVRAVPSAGTGNGGTGRRSPRTAARNTIW